MATGDKLVNLDGLKTVYDSIQGQFTDMHNNVAPAIVDTSSGPIATVDDGANDLPMRSVVAAIEPVQAGEGDPSPTNVRPITGWTAVSVVRTGKNLFDKTAVATGKRLSTTTGLEEADNSYCVTDYIPVSAGKTVYIPDSGTARRWFYDRNKTPTTYLNTSSAQAYTPAEDGYIRVTIATSGSFVKDLNTYQIEAGSTATAYEPYRGATVTADWQNVAGTVYGGTVDVVSGLLTVDRAMVDLGDLTWISETDVVTGLFRSNAGNMTNKPKLAGKLVCTNYKGIQQTSSQISDGAISVTNSQTWPLIRVRDIENLDGKTAEQAKEFLSGVMLVYELATPVTYQLTKQEVRTLLGLNHIYADTGNVSVIYPADTKLYIDRKLAALAAQIVNS